MSCRVPRPRALAKDEEGARRLGLAMRSLAPADAEALASVDARLVLPAVAHGRARPAATSRARPVVSGGASGVIVRCRGSDDRTWT